MKTILKTIAILFYSSFMLTAAEHESTYIPETTNVISAHFENNRLKIITDTREFYVDPNKMDEKLQAVLLGKQAPNNRENNKEESYLNWFFNFTLKVGAGFCDYAWWADIINQLAEYTGIKEYIIDLYKQMRRQPV